MGPTTMKDHKWKTKLFGNSIDEYKEKLNQYVENLGMQQVDNIRLFQLREDPLQESPHKNKNDNPLHESFGSNDNTKSGNNELKHF